LRAANLPATQSPEADARSRLERRASDRSKYEGPAQSRSASRQESPRLHAPLDRRIRQRD
jgi:hypothetical protein